MKTQEIQNTVKASKEAAENNLNQAKQLLKISNVMTTGLKQLADKLKSIKWTS